MQTYSSPWCIACYLRKCKAQAKTGLSLTIGTNMDKLFGYSFSVNVWGLTE